MRIAMLMSLAMLVSLAALAAAASTTNKLLKSIEAGVSVDDLQEVIATTDIDEADERGVTLLWASAFYEHVNAVELLLAAGADAEAATVDGQTAIFAAAHRGHADVLRVLLEASGDVDRPDVNGTTPAYAAARSGHVDALRVLVDSGADVNRAAKQMTPLWIAAKSGHVDVVALLLEAGAENTAARKGRDAAWVAARAGHADVLRLLGKHVDDLDRASSDGTTAVAEAAHAGHVDALRVLVAAGADVYKNTNGLTPLALAAQAGRADAVELLLDAGGAEERDVDVAARNGRTVVHIAAFNGHADVLRAMSEHGGDVDRADANGVTPLAVAAQEGHVDALRVLIDAGADVNAASEDGSTPLRVATDQWLEGRDREEVIALLEDAGAVEPVRGRCFGALMYLLAMTVLAYIDLSNVEVPYDGGMDQLLFEVAAVESSAGIGAETDEWGIYLCASTMALTVLSHHCHKGEVIGTLLAAIVLLMNASAFFMGRVFDSSSAGDQPHWFRLVVFWQCPLITVAFIYWEFRDRFRTPEASLGVVESRIGGDALIALQYLLPCAICFVSLSDRFIVWWLYGMVCWYIASYCLSVLGDFFLSRKSSDLRMILTATAGLIAFKHLFSRLVILVILFLFNPPGDGPRLDLLFVVAGGAYAVTIWREVGGVAIFMLLCGAAFLLLLFDHDFSWADPIKDAFRRWVSTPAYAAFRYARTKVRAFLRIRNLQAAEADWDADVRRDLYGRDVAGAPRRRRQKQLKPARPSTPEPQVTAATAKAAEKAAASLAAEAEAQADAAMRREAARDALKKKAADEKRAREAAARAAAKAKADAAEQAKAEARARAAEAERAKAARKLAEARDEHAREEAAAAAAKAKAAEDARARAKAAREEAAAKKLASEEAAAAKAKAQEDARVRAEAAQEEAAARFEEETAARARTDEAAEARFKASASASRVEPERGDAKTVAVLARLGLTDLLPLFQAEEIEDRDFVALVAGDLREMGVGEAAAARILAARDEKDVAEELLCPISCEVMTDPVSADDGHTYERACIEAWFAKGKRTSPATNELLESLKLRPNHVVRRMVAKYLAERA